MNSFSNTANTANTANTNSGAKSSARSGVKSNTKNNANSVNHNNTFYAAHYTTMDLCSQAQMSENADNILSRMDKLRAFASEQQAKRAKPQRQQTCFCF
jgi:hypothetical protein